MPRLGLNTFPASLPGEYNPAAKLTAREARCIRELYAAGNVSQRFLAGEFGISLRRIGQIVRNESYREGTEVPF